MSNRLISLFSGCGGMDEGFAQAGFETGSAYDLNRAALRSFSRNHGVRSARGDVRTRVHRADLSKVAPDDIVMEWELNELDSPVGIIGGPPCQAFSVSNVHPQSADPRAELVRHYSEILAAVTKAFRPKFFVLENVIGLSLNKHRPMLDEFKESARRAGYRVFEAPLDAQFFGVPQMRPRVFAVGLHKHTGVEDFEFPQGSLTSSTTVRDRIEGLPEPALYERGMRPSEKWIHPNHWTMKPKSPKFAPGNFKPGQVRGRSFRVLPWDGVSWTVAYGHREIHVHPNGIRRVSLYEALLLQGFPRTYVLEGTLSDQVSQVSDAVPPPLARAIAEAIKSQLGITGEDAQRSRNGHVPQSGLAGVQTA